jgi:hypothetical protein
MTILAELARRAASHPHATSFVKRAVEVHNGNGAEIDIPIWGVAVIYVSIFAASIFVSLVSISPSLPISCVFIATWS